MTSGNPASLAKKSSYVVGSRPKHVHTCGSGTDSVHQWECNSPYCEDMLTDCPEHNGPVPIILGREPWRGR